MTADEVDAATGSLPSTVTATANVELCELVVEWGHDCDVVTRSATSDLLLASGIFARRIRLCSDYAPWPLWWAPGLPEERAWLEEGEAIRALIQEELGPGYKVNFET